MVGVRCTTCLRGRKHQNMAAHQREETVTTHHLFPPVDVTQHQPQLVAADTGIFIADFTNVGEQMGVTLRFCANVSLGLVPGLTTTAKQTARECDFKIATLYQFRHCLAPDFFRIGMLKWDSAMSIIRSRASVSNLEKAKPFSNSLMRFFS